MTGHQMDPEQEADNIAVYRAGGLQALAAHMRDTGQLSGVDIAARLRDIRDHLRAKSIA